MDRLTKRVPGGHAWYNHQPGKTVSNDDLLARLAAYEDTGLGPEDMAAVRLLAASADHDKSVRLLELSKADEDGRLVVLPCKIDEPIYILLGEKEKRKLKYRVVECHIDHFAIGGTLVPMITACDDENEWYELIDGTRVGHEYWLTREEAEAALEG